MPDLTPLPEGAETLRTLSADTQTLRVLGEGAETLLALAELLAFLLGGTWPSEPSGSPTLPGVVPGPTTYPGGWTSGGTFPSVSATFPSIQFSSDAPGLTPAAEDPLTLTVLGEV